MGSTNSGAAGTADVVPDPSVNMTTVRGSDGCAMAKDRL